MPLLLGSCWDEVGSAVNESVTVRSEERAIYTLSRNLTVQIYVGSSDTDLGTFDVRRQPTNQQRPRCRDSRHGSGLPTIGSSDVRRDFRRAQTAGQ